MWGQVFDVGGRIGGVTEASDTGIEGCWAGSCWGGKEVAIDETDAMLFNSERDGSDESEGKRIIKLD